MNLLTRKLKSVATGMGVDLFGVASVDRLMEAPDGYRVTDYVPDAKYAISMAMRYGGGVVEAAKRGRLNPYRFYQYRLVSKLNDAVFEVCRALERQGYGSLPIAGLDPKGLHRRPEIYPFGDVSHRHVAVAAGLGEFGWSSLVLTPQYGPYQMLASVITAAPLSPSKLFDGGMCKPEGCGYRCVKACPTSAISRTETDEFCIGGVTFRHGKLSRYRCLWGCSGLSGKTGLRDIPMPDKESDDWSTEYLEAKKLQDPWQIKFKADCKGVAVDLFCNRCLWSCPAGKADMKID